MTKPGFKSVTIPESLHSLLEQISKQRNISISKVIEGVIGGLPSMADNREVLRSNRSGPIPLSGKADKNEYHTETFAKFLKLQKNLSNKTIKDHLQVMDTFFNSGLSVEDFLLQTKETKSVSSYRNYLGTLRIYFRDYLKQPDIVDGYEMPNRTFKPKLLPDKQHLRIFYDSLPHNKYRSVFLLLASSGLRISELLTAQIDRKNRMLIPKPHDGKTKFSWVSFYNNEAELLLNEFVPLKKDTVIHTFTETARETGTNISAHTLRSVFAREASRAGIPDRYIDAFCGRTPQTVLARHYSDFSPEVLKEIYNKDNIKIF